MARIRSIKPEITQDAKLASLSRECRYHFVLLWTVADDEGYFRASPRLLFGQLYPHDADMNEGRVAEMNGALAKLGVLELRASNDGPIGWLVNWSKHQKIDRPSKSYLRDTFASVAREVPETFDAGVLSPESRVLKEEPPRDTREKPQQPPSAAKILARIKSLAQSVDVPGQGTKTFIPRTEVEKLGPRTFAAYERIGGAEAVLKTPGDKWMFLVKDFDRELKSA